MRIKAICEWILDPSDPVFLRHLQSWCNKSYKFLTFCEYYKSKIRKKWKTAVNYDDKRDLFSELEIACLLSETEYDIEYEKYGMLPGRSPDLTILSSDRVIANFEVCRIRETSRMCDFRNWQKLVGDCIKKLELPVDVWLDWVDLRDPIVIFDNLRESFNTAIEIIKKQVQQTAIGISPKEKRSWQLEILDNVMRITLIGKSNITDGVSFFPCIFPVIYTHEEYRKFGDIILAKLGQMRPGEVNVIVVHITSTTHEAIDAIDGIRKLLNAPDTFFERRSEITDKLDLKNKLQHLSAVLVRSIWTNHQKPRNEIISYHEANYELPEDISAYLQSADIN